MKRPTRRVYKYVTEVLLALKNSVFMVLGEGPAAGAPGVYTEPAQTIHTN